MTIDKQVEPHEILQKFYEERGIGEEDLDAKYRAMKESVMIPNFPYDQREPALYELEMQYVSDQGQRL